MRHEPRNPGGAPPEASVGGANRPSTEDGRVVARYLHLLRTAPPATLEAVHADAFRALSAAQRADLLESIREVLPPSERGLAVPVNGTPIGLARLLTRAQARQPGTLARLFGTAAGAATWAAAGLLGAVAGAVAASAIAAPLLAEAARSMAAAGSGAPVASDLDALPAETGPWTAEGSGPVGHAEAPATFAEPSADPVDPDEVDLVADAGPTDDLGLDLDLDLGDLFDA